MRYYLIFEQFNGANWRWTWDGGYRSIQMAIDDMNGYYNNPATYRNHWVSALPFDRLPISGYDW